MVLEKMRRRAIKAAAKSKCERYKHGCLVFDKGKIISSSCNFKKTHPRGSGVHSSMHAEIRAILQALRIRKNLRGCSIYVVRINSEGLMKMSKPCLDCQKLIKENGLKMFWSE